MNNSLKVNANLLMIISTVLIGIVLAVVTGMFYSEYSGFLTHVVSLYAKPIMIGGTLFAIAFFLTTIFYLRLAKKTIESIQTINSVVKGYANGNWDQNLEFNNADEINEILYNVHFMAQQTNANMHKLNEATVAAKSANDAKKAFLTNMSHDMYTPMNAIVNYSQLAISQPGLTEKVNGYLCNILQAGNRLLTLIDSVMEMSKIESDELEINPIPCNICELIKELDNYVSSNMGEKNKTFISDASGIKHENILCDSLKLNQVIISIVDNAIKYTEEGGTISVSVWEEEKENAKESVYHFEIEDSGIGMDESFAQNLFTPFEREEASTTNKIDGVGLGLAISKNIIESMHGNIRTKSKKGEGTVIYIDIPFPLEIENEVKPNVFPEKYIDLETKDLSNEKILLVEDNAINRMIVKEILKDKVGLIDEAKNGKAAVEMILNHEAGYYSLVLMDVQMPIMNGYEATKAIRAMEDKQNANIPIIAVTANAFEEDKILALENGMNALVPKPIDYEFLLSTMSSFV